MKAEVFGESWLEVELPFACEIHHCRIRALPSPNKFKVLNLVGEPKSLLMQNADVRRYASQFDLIVTLDETLLDLDNAAFMLFGTSWITSSPVKKQLTLSFLYSGGIKTDMDGYRLRQDLWKVKEYIGMERAFWTSAIRQRAPAVEDLNPYPYESKMKLFESMFTLVVENSAEKNYFSEKIVDAFRTYTVPIYYGCTNIGSYFDTDGIMQFSTAEQFLACVNKLTEDDYWRAMPAMQTNYEKSAAYLDLGGRLKTLIASLK